MQALSTVKAGTDCTIKWMFGIPEVLDFLRSRDFEEGSKIHIVQRIADGVIISNGKTRLALDGQVASRIQV